MLMLISASVINDKDHAWTLIYLYFLLLSVGKTISVGIVIPVKRKGLIDSEKGESSKVFICQIGTK